MFLSSYVFLTTIGTRQMSGSGARIADEKPNRALRIGFD